MRNLSLTMWSPTMLTMSRMVDVVYSNCSNWADPGECVTGSVQLWIVFQIRWITVIYSPQGLSQLHCAQKICVSAYLWMCEACVLVCVMCMCESMHVSIPICMFQCVCVCVSMCECVGSLKQNYSLANKFLGLSAILNARGTFGVNGNIYWYSFNCSSFALVFSFGRRAPIHVSF